MFGYDDSMIASPLVSSAPLVSSSSHWVGSPGHFGGPPGHFGGPQHLKGLGKGLAQGPGKGLAKTFGSHPHVPHDFDPGNNAAYKSCHACGFMWNAWHHRRCNQCPAALPPPKSPTLRQSAVGKLNMSSRCEYYAVATPRLDDIVYEIIDDDIPAPAKHVHVPRVVSKSESPHRRRLTFDVDLPESSSDGSNSTSPSRVHDDGYGPPGGIFEGLSFGPCAATVTDRLAKPYVLRAHDDGYGPLGVNVFGSCAAIVSDPIVKPASADASTITDVGEFEHMASLLHTNPYVTKFAVDATNIEYLQTIMLQLQDQALALKLKNTHFLNTIDVLRESSNVSSTNLGAITDDMSKITDRIHVLEQVAELEASQQVPLPHEVPVASVPSTAPSQPIPPGIGSALAILRAGHVVTPDNVAAIDNVLLLLSNLTDGSIKPCDESMPSQPEPGLTATGSVVRDKLPTPFAAPIAHVPPEVLGVSAQQEAERDVSLPSVTEIAPNPKRNKTINSEVIDAVDIDLIGADGYNHADASAVDDETISSMNDGVKQDKPKLSQKQRAAIRKADLAAARMTKAKALAHKALSHHASRTVISKHAVQASIGTVIPSAPSR